MDWPAALMKRLIDGACTMARVVLPSTSSIVYQSGPPALSSHPYAPFDLSKAGSMDAHFACRGMSN
jgi:hypothetical protein